MLTAGSAFAMEVPRFRIALAENPKLHGRCESYSQAFFVASRLQQEELIRRREGSITILDRRKLQAAACDCYQRLHDGYYKRLLAD